MNNTGIPLRPFTYHHKLRDYLQKKPKLWSWFSEDKTRDEFVKLFKENILKDSYRMNRVSHAAVYEALDEITEKLNLPLEIIVYQEQMSYQNNVSVLFNDNEAHIVISGRVLQMLTPEEMKAVLAHEVYHYYFFNIDKKSYEVADRILTGVANSSESSELYRESGRLFKLYTELYCDRGAFEIMGDLTPMITSLVKLHTGVDKVNVEAYLKQANEVLSKEKKSTENLTHPETYIRAKALELWKEKKEDSNDEIENLIEPKIEFENLNIFTRSELNALTERLVQLIIKPSWNRTSRLLNLGKEYFPALSVNDELNADIIFQEISKCGESTKKYLAYVLLDFALADPDQGNVSLGYAFEISENTGMKNEFNLAVKKEVKLTERALRDLQKDAMQSLNTVNESKEDSLYGE